MLLGFSLAWWLVYFFCYENVYDGDDVHYTSLESFCNSCYTPDVYPNATYTEEVMQTQTDIKLRVGTGFFNTLANLDHRDVVWMLFMKL